MAKYSIINDAPTRRSWSWKLGPFISAGSFYKSSMGHYFVREGVVSYCSLFYPFYCKPSLFKIVGLRGVRKRGCELLQYTLSHYWNGAYTWCKYGIIRSNGWCRIFMGKIRHASYNSRSSGFTTTISNLLLLFHSCILLVYQNYCKRLCTLKRLVYLNIVLEKCSRWKFAAHDEQQYDDHQGKVAFWFGVLSIPPQVQGILIAPCRPSTGAVIEQHIQTSVFCLCVEIFKWRTDGECEAASIVCAYSSTSQPLFTSDDPRIQEFRLLLA